MTNPDDLLMQVRALVYVMPQAYPRDNSAARLLADTFDKLDAHLTAGGAPPEVWQAGLAHYARTADGSINETSEFPSREPGEHLPGCTESGTRGHVGSCDRFVPTLRCEACDRPAVGMTVDDVAYCAPHAPRGHKDRLIEAADLLGITPDALLDALDTP